jgi:hypothetical protein
VTRNHESDANDFTQSNIVSISFHVLLESKNDTKADRISDSDWSSRSFTFLLTRYIYRQEKCSPLSPPPVFVSEFNFTKTINDSEV